MKAFIVLTLLIMIMVTINKTLPRGIRNNNPGNIRRNAIQWEGMQARQDDADFVQFVSPEYGFRAMVRILRSYERRGLVTVRDIISTYAPISENHTEAYVKFVADHLQVNPEFELDLTASLLPLIKAITLFEQGAAFASFYSDNTMQNGIALA